MEAFTGQVNADHGSISIQEEVYGDTRVLKIDRGPFPGVLPELINNSIFNLLRGKGGVVHNIGIFKIAAHNQGNIRGQVLMPGN
ncbi:hypothetical protein ES705_47250 [subsurface metagenome]